MFGQISFSSTITLGTIPQNGCDCEICYFINFWWVAFHGLVWDILKRKYRMYFIDSFIIFLSSYIADWSAKYFLIVRHDVAYISYFKASSLLYIGSKFCSMRLRISPQSNLHDVLNSYLEDCSAKYFLIIRHPQSRTSDLNSVQWDLESVRQVINIK